MARVIQRVEEERVFEAEEGVKITISKPMQSDLLVLAQTQDKPERVVELLMSRIKKIEGLEYPDGEHVAVADIPPDLLWSLFAFYMKWHNELSKNGLAALANVANA